MKKKQVINFLNSISNLLEDDEANEAIDLLLEKVEEQLEDESTGKGQGQFPVPKNFKGDYLLFSDGACRGNPGPGAWGVLAQDSDGEVIFESAGFEFQTTNNRMELEGALQALKGLLIHDPDGASKSVTLYSDSKYVLDGLEKWVPGWKSRGWKKADKKPPENLEIWQNLDEVYQKYSDLNLSWVKGHSGHPQNEHVDQLANQALDENGC